MGIGTSLFLFAIGAILAFAVNVNTNGVDLNTIGMILMLVGIVGILLSLAFWNSWGGFGSYRRETVVDGGSTRRRVVEEETA